MRGYIQFECSTIDQIPSNDKIYSLLEDKNITLNLYDELRDEKYNIRDKLRIELFDCHIGMGLKGSVIYIEPGISEEIVVENIVFFKNCVSDYDRLANELIEKLAKENQIVINYENPSESFSFLGKTALSNFLGDWEYKVNEYYCDFINVKSGQKLKVALKNGKNFGTLRAVYFTEFITSNAHYYPLPFKIHNTYHCGDFILKILNRKGAIEKFYSYSNTFFAKEIRKSKILESVDERHSATKSKNLIPSYWDNYYDTKYYFGLLADKITHRHIDVKPYLNKLVYSSCIKLVNTLTIEEKRIYSEGKKQFIRYSFENNQKLVRKAIYEEYKTHELHLNTKKRESQLHSFNGNEFSISEIIDFEYNSSQLLTVIKVYVKNELTYFEKVEYQLEKKRYLHKSYNKLGKLIAEKFENFNYMPEFEEFNEKGDLIRFKNIDDFPEAEVYNIFEYEYDENDNWIKRVNYRVANGLKNRKIKIRNNQLLE